MPSSRWCGTPVLMWLMESLRLHNCVGRMLSCTAEFIVRMEPWGTGLSRHSLTSLTNYMEKHINPKQRYTYMRYSEVQALKHNIIAHWKSAWKSTCTLKQTK
eukprot:scaffold163752_cov18-Prasinocladus_malaysianus.AAC.1